MSQTVTAIQAPAPLGRIDGHTNYATLEYIVANGVTINYGDFVKYSSGTVTNASMTGDSRPLGMALGTSTGNAGGTVTVLVCVDPNMRYLIKTSGSNFATTTRGQYYDLASASQIDQSTASTTTGVFILLSVGSDTVPNSPVIGIQGANTAAFGVFKIIESALNPLGS